MSGVEHKITSTDGPVRGHPGTISLCVCGWSSAWAVQDGSAESDGDQHMRERVPGYAEAQAERQRQWLAECEVRQAQRTTELAAYLATNPKPTITPELCHECTCFLNPPCSNCENCNHYAGEITDCEHDCRNCEEDHDTD